jgi:predicted permease
MPFQIAQSAKSVFFSLWRRPLYSSFALLALAVGIGPTTAIYAVFHNVLLRKLAVVSPQDLHILEHFGDEPGSINAYGGQIPQYFSEPAYRSLNAAWPQLAAAAVRPVNFASDGFAVQTTAALVSGNYFDVTHKSPIMGRLLSASDDRTHAANPVINLSRQFWLNQFGGRTDILNRVVDINGSAFTIVGVVADSGLYDALPADFFLPMSGEQSISLGREDLQDQALARWLVLIARYSKAEESQATKALGTAWIAWRQNVLSQRPTDFHDKAAWLRTPLVFAQGGQGIADLARDLKVPLIIIQCMTVLLLVIACANVANLMIAAAGRGKTNNAIRIVLGASRSRIQGEALLEGVFLGIGGSILGCGLGWLCLKGLEAATTAGSTNAIALHAPFNPGVAAVALIGGLLASLLASIGPARALLRIEPLETLGGGTRNNIYPNRSRSREFGVVVTMALGFVLICGGVIFSWNLWKLIAINPGFRTNNMIVLSLDESSTGASSAKTESIYNELASRIGTIPSVEAVSYGSVNLLTGYSATSPITIIGRQPRAHDPEPNQNWVSDSYFRVLGIPLLRGRAISANDNDSTERVAVVDEEFVKRFCDGNAEQCLQAHFQIGRRSVVYRVIGVIASIRASQIDQVDSVPYIYLSYAQIFHKDSGFGNSYPATFYINTAAREEFLFPALQTAVRSVDSKLPILSLETMHQQINDGLADNRMLAIMSIAMGLVACLLSSVGLLGILSMYASSRQREFGLMLALGAGRRRVLLKMVKLTFRMTAIGLFFGGAAVYVLLKIVKSYYAQLGNASSLVYFVSAIFIILGSILASILPAIRTVMVDPVKSLREG